MRTVTPREALINRLACSYTKALALNPKDTLYDNIARMVDDTPALVESYGLVEALEIALCEIQKGGTVDREIVLEKLLAALASTREQS